MKTPEEYLIKRVLNNWGTDLTSIKESIKQAQKDAYNQALEDVSDNNVQIITNDNPWEMYPDGLADGTYSHNYVEETYSYVDKQSILKLKIK